MTIARTATELDVASPNAAFKHVLVPLDGSKLALSAIPTAHALAQRFDAEVHAISVATDDEAADSLLAVGRAAVGAGPSDDRMVVITDVDPADAIARRANELRSCLVVMSTSARGRGAGAILGSVARSVLTEVGPIVALGPVADRPLWTPPPARWLPPLSASRIVACVDGSIGSEAVLPEASAWARGLRMSLSIVMVIEDTPEPLRPRWGAARYGTTIDPTEYVQQLAARWQPAVPEIDAVVIRDPIGPDTGIRLHLAERPAGLVAVSTQARSGLRRIVQGATADKIIRSSVVPCLVVHQ